MANNLSVVVLTPNGRRNTVKCNSNTTILQILEQTCTKHGFKAEEYDLTHHNHILDVTTTFRFSGLPNNASLEMCEIKNKRKESDVVLGLQLESGERVMGNFNPSTDLYTILTCLVPEQSSPELNPVIIYTRREVFGLEALQQTTLRSLGLTGGRAIIRLIHRTPEQLKIQANVSSPLISKPKEIPDVSFNTSSIFSSTQIKDQDDVTRDSKADVDKSVPCSSTMDSDNILNESFVSTKGSPYVGHDDRMDTADSNTINVQESYTKMETDQIIKESVTEDNSDVSQLEDEIIVLGERNALVFSMDMASRLSYDDLPDDFYDLTVDEVKRLFRDLRQKREDLENTPLQTSALKNLEENRRVITQLHDYRKVVLRILFPDRTVLQGTFGPLETIQTVMNFVRDYLQDPNEAFCIYVTPPKQVLKSETSLVDANCVPSALLHFGPCVSEAEISEIPHRQYLKDNILSKLTSPSAATLSATKSRGIKYEQSKLSNNNTESTNSNTSGSKKSGRSQPFSVPGPSRAKDSKVPKWFKPAV